MNDEDRGYIFLTHLFTAIPLWGILFNGIMWHAFKEKSRDIVFNAQQGIFFQAIFLAAVLMGLIVHLFTKLVSVINGSLASVLSSVNFLIIILFMVAYELTCLFAMWNTLQGRNFEYPIIGEKLRE